MADSFEVVVRIINGEDWIKLSDILKWLQDIRCRPEQEELKHDLIKKVIRLKNAKS